jgi:hypothetical protein
MNIESKNNIDITLNNKPLPVKSFKINSEDIKNNASSLQEDCIELTEKSIKTNPFESNNKVLKSIPLVDKKELNYQALEKIELSENESEQYDLIINILKENNAKINTSSDKRNIVAFRNPNLPTENNRKGVYDDITFVFWKDKDGNKKVEKFITNTDPNGLFIGDRPKGDFGRIKSGKTYTFAFSSSTNYGDVLRPISKIDIERYSPNDEVYKDAKTSLDVDRTFLFHKGNPLMNKNNLYDKNNMNTLSMGCQTFPDIYDKTTKTWENQFENFWEDLGGTDKSTRQKELFYTILDIN